MKQTQILPVLLLLFIPLFGFSQYSYEDIFGEYIFEVNGEPIYEKLILKENYKFGFQRKTSLEFADKEAELKKNQYKGLIGKYALEEDKIVLAPTKMWVKKRKADVYSETDPEIIEKQGYMPKTMFILEEDGQIFLKVNNDIWVKTK